MLLKNLTLVAGQAPDAAGKTPAAGKVFDLVPDAAIAISGAHILWAGPEADLPADLAAKAGAEGGIKDLGGRLVSPGLIDCHSHLVFGGDRAMEFDMRLNGAGYEEIARAGGGILSTVRATRAESEESLLASALRRLDHLLAEGLCTIEVKSGYGLDIETELKMLRVARRLEQERKVRVRTSWLAAHAVPAEYREDRAGYIRDVVLAGLDRAHAEGLVDAVDGFCENIAFSPDEIALVFDHAKKLGLPVKLHAEQLSDLNGAALAAGYQALSADHLEWLSQSGVEAMAQAGTVAVLLPGAFYTLRESQYPPVSALRAAGVPIALATDSNPGTSPLTSALLTMNMGATIFRLTPAECLAGFTGIAARALGLHDRGQILAGNLADLAIWDISHPSELAYRIGFNPLHARIFGGRYV